MSDNKTNTKFTPTHHALLFAWISKEVVLAFGEKKAEPVIREAVKQYGIQRGKRMALRAKADGRELNMLNYLVYGEWSAPDNEMEMETLKTNPDLNMQVKKCCWSTAWEDNDLMQYGRYYCLEVDEALVFGYNPDLKLDVEQTMSNGGEYCDFCFHEANLNFFNKLRMVSRKRKLVSKAVMPWDYHTAHLLKAIGDVIRENFGKEGGKAVKRAVKEFEKHYGSEALKAVQYLQNINFNLLP